MADLTRFDFHVLRFMKSLDVMAMSDAEVGQYILLLSESWLIGDACTLPDKPELLARLARTSQVSENVLKKFPVSETEFGTRRRNPVLYNEWLLAEERSISAAERGKKGNEARYGAARTSLQRGISDSNSESAAVATNSPKPNQAVSVQSVPVQSNDIGNFKNIAVRYRRVFHVNLSHGSLQKEEYSKACREFSEDIVLAQFDDWAPGNMWIKERKHTNGLRQFYESLSASIEADAAIKQDEENIQSAFRETTAAEHAAIEAAQAAHAEDEKRLVDERKENEEIARRVAENPSAILGL